ncbi:hypothetical protein AWB78_01084 [Caballeronia calidae]|uniref:Uncharacterized protein n=1 Tax=Caballeronia calidae TaxID=1777139 RepID=A0A157ZZ91_9BURK|nr:hypothetical protein [Caballeronia calidae]SAK50851.1 hypothetical protein AWB78_01084 [Caballeronia calidae]
MNQVIVGVFGCYRDGHDALRALQLAGLRRDDAHLYRAGRGEIDIDALLPPAHHEDDAEYVAHGEHQGVIGARNRFVPHEPLTPHPPATHTSDDPTPQRTLLVIRITDDIKPGAIGELLHEHGAIAVKDPSGHWRFSPFRNPARV